MSAPLYQFGLLVLAGALEVSVFGEAWARRLGVRADRRASAIAAHAVLLRIAFIVYLPNKLALHGRSLWTASGAKYYIFHSLGANGVGSWGWGEGYLRCLGTGGFHSTPGARLFTAETLSSQRFHHRGHREHRGFLWCVFCALYGETTVHR